MNLPKLFAQITLMLITNIATVKIAIQLAHCGIIWPESILLEYGPSKYRQRNRNRVNIC